MVKRYEIQHDKDVTVNDGNRWVCDAPDGDQWMVLASDYEALEAENARLRELYRRACNVLPLVPRNIGTALADEVGALLGAEPQTGPRLTDEQITEKHGDTLRLLAKDETLPVQRPCGCTDFCVRRPNLASDEYCFVDRRQAGLPQESPT